MLDGITFVSHVLPAHLENHRWAAAVLNSCIASKLDQVSVAEHCCDVVTLSFDLLNLLHSEVQLLALSDSKLI